MTAEITEPTAPLPPAAAAPAGESARTESAAHEGELLGPYRLLQRLGQGGMGVVHFAVDPHGRAVAVKVLRPHIADDPDARARLEREVQALGRVRHPRVAPVIDADLHSARPYVVTRFVDGDPLDEAILAGGPLRGPALLRVARGLFGALEAIHAVGVVHRDLKPGNVLLDDDGDPVVIDFGIAHVIDDARLTSTGLVMGTPGYLSPEIVEGAAVTDATDWWGWAATLAFAATGRAPFGRGSMDVVLTRVRMGHFDLTGVDPRLEPLLAAALSPRPHERPPAPLVLAALERYAAGASATVDLPIPPTAREPRPASLGPSGGPPPAAPAPASAPRLRAPAAAAARPAGQPPLAAPAARPSAAAPSYAAALPYAGGPAASVAPVPIPAAPSAGGPVAAGVPADAGGWGVAAYGEQDPRIGRPDRVGPLGGLAVLLVTAAALVPGVAVLAAVVWSWLARTADRSVTSLLLRRHRYGRRRGDVAVTVAKSPAHVVGSVIGALLAALPPALVGAAGFVCVALAMGAAGAARSALTVPLGLGAGMVIAIATAWWGPGGASLRRGSKSLARGVAPQGLVGDIVTAVCWALALGAVGWLVSRQGQPIWWPLSGRPAAFDTLR